jgi:holo-[acyl-carrier protein] synthase
MIIGIGVDIVQIDRIERLVTEYGDHFLHKVYTENEIAYCQKSARPSIHFSGRWAVKEAFYKAIPLFCQEVSSWKSIETLGGEGTRRPVIRVCSERLEELLRRSNVSSMNVSISHEKTMCVAVVALS